MIGYCRCKFDFSKGRSQIQVINGNMSGVRDPDGNVGLKGSKNGIDILL